jgi:putative Holliday junction resolvase
MNILAIDFGKKRIGLAWTDTGVGVILPFGVIEKPTLASQADAVAKLLTKENIDEAVVGLPLGLDGKENENTKTVRAFMEQLKAASQKPIAAVDERFTSAGADRMSGDLPRQTGATRDEKAAMMTLQSYLDSR